MFHTQRICAEFALSPFSEFDGFQHLRHAFVGITFDIGDNFTYSAKVKISDGSPVASIFVDSFDKKMKIMTWGYSKIMFEELNKWVKLVKTFSITDKDVKYIRFRINGVGKGEYRFDDIVFKRNP